MERKHKIQIAVLCLGAILLGTAGNQIFGWASMKWVAHHQYILKEAYKLLMKDPVVLALKEAGHFHFPPLDQILDYEGVYYASLGKSGPGPDSEEHSYWSWHYYNPRTGEGNAPSQAAKYYERLRDKLLYPAREIPVDIVVKGKPHDYKKDLTGARDAAYLAHFIADMSVPYHINGMWGKKAARLHKEGQTFLHEKIVGPTGKGPEDWAREFKRWHGYYTEKPLADWFDPWYFDYYGIPVISAVSHSHIIWEGAYGTITRHTALEGFTPDYLILQRQQNEAGGSLTYAALDFAAQIAQYTSFRQSEWWIHTDENIFGKMVEEALGHSIRNVYTIWRASFSALQPELEVVHDPLRNRHDVVIKINNRTWEETPTHLRVRAKIQGGEMNGPKWPDWHEIEESPYGDYWSDLVVGDIWNVTRSDPGAVITVEVEGHYAKMPDAGRAVLEKAIAQVDIQPMPMGPVVFQEDDIQKIDPQLSAGQTTQRKEDYYNPISELRIDPWAKIDRQDGLLVQSFEIEQYLEKERARDVFDHYLKGFNERPESYKQDGVEHYSDKIAVEVNPEKTEASIQYKTRSMRNNAMITTWFQESVAIHLDTFIIYNLVSIEKEKDSTSALTARWEHILANSRALIDRRSGGR
jgi:hypothetical protein